MHTRLIFRSWLGLAVCLTQVGRLNFPGLVQIWADCAISSAAAAGIVTRKLRQVSSADWQSCLSLPGGCEAGWSRAVSFGGFTLCRIKKKKKKLDPFKACGKPEGDGLGITEEDVGITGPVVCEQVSALAMQGRFLLRFLCIAPAKSWFHFTRLNGFFLHLCFQSAAEWWIFSSKNG